MPALAASRICADAISIASAVAGSRLSGERSGPATASVGPTEVVVHAPDPNRFDNQEAESIGASAWPLPIAPALTAKKTMQLNAATKYVTRGWGTRGSNRALYPGDETEVTDVTSQYNGNGR